MTPLDKIIRDKIKTDGPMRVDEFMELALGDPEHGYYRTRDPLGRSGDFTTAPEISQMFGEVLGLWAIDVWQKLGAPKKFHLVEVGPGRGTLMADALRAVRRMPGFSEAARIVLIETSPVLIARQREMLAEYEVQWLTSLSDLRREEPVILWANEFLDALPIRQFDGAGKERTILLQPDGNLIFSTADKIREESPMQHEIIRETAALLKKQRGVALFIDYGYRGPAVGDTLQAIKGHRFAPVLHEIGAVDLTAHVDFTAIARAAGDVDVQGPAEQGAFLRQLGIDHRADRLRAVANPAQRMEIDTAHTRLTAADQMGKLFKAMALSHGLRAPPEGF